MKQLKKALCVFLCAVLSFAIVFGTAPVTVAAGMLRLIVEDTVYSKVYTNIGSVALLHWSYDVSDDKLILSNFGTASNPKPMIFAYPYSGKLTVELRGDNYIKADGEPGLVFIGDVTFVGSGSLTLMCKDSYCFSSEYAFNVTEGVSMTMNGYCGVSAEGSISIDTTGSFNVNAVGKCTYTGGDIRITKGFVRLSGSSGLFSYGGNVIMSGGDTDVEVISTQKAIHLTGAGAYTEWSANAVVRAGESMPGSVVSEYNDEKYFHASFSGLPKLNPPRTVNWDQTVINGEPNPVGRWSAVEHASGYFVKLYYKNNYNTFNLIETFTVTNALSCNFGGHFAGYGNYYYTVQALGDDLEYVSSNDSALSSSAYYYTGDVESRYYITLPEADYYTITPVNGTTVCYYGQSYSFTLEVDEAYDQSQVKVWANGVRVALRHGLYTIDNVTENVEVTVGEMQINTYSVILPESEAFTLYPLPGYSTEVEYGGSFSFSIELSDIYLQSYPIVKANGVELYAKYGIIYTINNIRETQTITVEGLIRDYYDVEFTELDGTVISTQTVDHGYTATPPATPSSASNLTFKGWYLKDGSVYDFSTPVTNSVTIYARYEAQKDSDGSYLIPDLNTLKWFRDEVNYGNGAIDGRLTNDINCNPGKYVLVGTEPVFAEDAVNWKPIGGYDYTDPDDYVRFYSGSFDGAGHTLKGFYCADAVMDAGSSDLGVFGIISADSSVTDLKVKDSFFSGYERIGSVVGTAYGTVSSCESSAVCEGVSSVGGIIGSAGGDITSCSFSGKVTVSQFTEDAGLEPIGGDLAGGIAGSANAAIAVTDCVNSGEISAYDGAGGMVAGGVGLITYRHCFNVGTVSSGTFAGGFAAFGDLDIEYCYNAGQITADTAAAGLCPQSDSARVHQCHSYGTVVGGGEPFVPASDGVSVTQSYYVSEKFPAASNGLPGSTEWFACGYTANLMNKACGLDLWADSGVYPVFTDEDHPAFHVSFAGSGSRNDPFIISTEQDLRLAACLMNNEDGYLSQYYKLDSDITVIHGELQVIGSRQAPFTGGFDGAGHSLTNVVINRPGDNNVGLFAAVQNGKVNDLVLSNVQITGGTNVGVIAGAFTGGYLYDVEIVSGSVSGTSYVGGAAGRCSASVSDIVNRADVSGRIIVGGIFGYLEDNDLAACENYGNISGSDSSDMIGGIVGFNTGFLMESKNSGAVSGGSQVGGICGNNSGTLYSDYNDASVTGSGSFGGICGFSENDAEIDSCYYYTAVVSSAGNSFGTRQPTSNIYNGLTAYYLNQEGGNIAWAQSENGPVHANEDGSDAIINCVSFYSGGALFYRAATYFGGSVTAEGQPSIPGYNFLYWDTDTSEVYESVDVHAVFDRDFALTLTPTATVSLTDDENGVYIVGVTPGMTCGELMSMIANENIDINTEYDEPADLNAPVATGYKVQLYDEEGMALQYATVVVFGDIDSDGKVDMFDEFLLNCIINGAFEETDLSLAQHLAADIDGSGSVDADDFSFFQQVIFGLEQIEQTRVLTAVGD